MVGEGTFVETDRYAIAYLRLTAHLVFFRCWTWKGEEGNSMGLILEARSPTFPHFQDLRLHLLPFPASLLGAVGAVMEEYARSNGPDSKRLVHMMINTT